MELKAAARQYWLQGCNIVPLKGKQPLVSWARWQHERQDELSFEALPWSEADGFAIICGQQLYDGMYIAAIDFDVKNLPEDVVNKGREALRFLPVTQREQTFSGGEHWIYLCREKPRTISAYHNACGLELLGEGKLCIMAPSNGYRRLNDNTPTEVENLEAVFLEALEKAGVKVEKPQQAWFDQPELAKQPYKGRDPPCIRELLKGVQEGLRNEAGIRLASYYINFKGYSPETVRKSILKEWNKLNSPSLPWRELDSIVKSAVQGRYVYGCSDSILSSFCDRENCPIAPRNIAKTLTPEERERAERLLADPKLLDYVVAYGRRSLLGEDNVLLMNFIAICSGQTKYPISMIIAGFSGSGKNQSIRAIRPLVPEEWVYEFTTSTPEAIKYIPEDFSGTLLIYELSGVKSETGTLGLRSIGEGESIETIYPIRDELTGKMRLCKTRTNARNFITTQTDVEVYPDLYRRVLQISMNDSDVLTKRVIAKKLRDAWVPETLCRKVGWSQPQLPYTEKDFQNALRLLDWKAEVIVFPPLNLLKLIELAPKKEQKVALRSQVERILNFIRVLALLFQRQRITIEDTSDGSRYVIASPEDVEKALQILMPAIKETVSRIEKRQDEALEIIASSPEDHWDKNKLAEKMGVSTVTAARILKALARNGVLREIQTTRPYSYELVGDVDKLKQLVLLENTSEYRTFYEKELRKFLDGILSSYHSLVVRGVVQNICIDVQKCATPLSHTGDEKIRCQSEEEKSSSKLNSQEKLVFPERTRQKQVEDEKTQDSTSFKLLECPNCNCKFASQVDLQNHLIRLHGGERNG